MRRRELLEDVLALLRDLDQARETDGAAPGFSCRKEAVLERVHQALAERDRLPPAGGS